ncbi:hypothetical protein SERLADRAFT_468874, partial [Serpula lacrymans var. lacrymans S7.9]
MQSMLFDGMESVLKPINVRRPLKFRVILWLGSSFPDIPLRASSSVVLVPMARRSCRQDAEPVQVEFMQRSKAK